MRARHLLGVVIIVATAGRSYATDFGAVDAVRRYSLALMSNDCETMYALTSPRLMVRDQRPNETRDMLCQLTAQLNQDGVVETIDPPKAILTDGPRKLVIVPAHREGGKFPERSVTDLDYVVHSGDSGRTWKILDLGCVDARWVREIFPAYTGEPPVTAANARSVPPWKHDR